MHVNYISNYTSKNIWIKGIAIHKFKRVPLGEDIQNAEKIFEEKTRENKQNMFDEVAGEEIPESTQHTTMFDPNAIRYTLWAEGEDVYFMANIKQPDGTMKDTLFSYHPTDNTTKKLLIFPCQSLSVHFLFYYTY